MGTETLPKIKACHSQWTLVNSFYFCKMDEDDKNPREVNPIRSVGCVVGYFIVGLVIYLFFAWVF